MATREVWKTIPGHKGYQASNLGRIRSTERLVGYRLAGMFALRQGRVLRQFKNSSGYFVVVPGQKWHAYVHRLVASAFLGDIPKGFHVCHTNGNPLDNRLSNLRIDTPRGNARDTVKLGRSSNQYGTQNSRSKRQRSPVGGVG